MSLTALNWPLIVALIAISGVFLFQPRSRVSRGDQLNTETGKMRLEDYEVGLMAGKIGETDANGARHAPPPLPASSSRAWGHGRRAVLRMLIAPVVVFLTVAGIGAATSHFGNSPTETVSGNVPALSVAGSDPDGEMLSSLADYAGSIGTQSPPAAADKMLPDVSTMIERLAARLEARPNDPQGWQMLGWSYFNTGRYGEAAAAYEKALALDPSSDDLKLALKEAKARTSTSGSAKTTASEPSEVVAEAGNLPNAEMPGRERDAAIRSMVDRLAARLESSPRDVDGWTRLMRSRVVLGEREVATAALRKALAVFKDDATASSKIAEAATALGLQPQ